MDEVESKRRLRAIAASLDVEMDADVERLLLDTSAEFIAKAEEYGKKMGT